jgi:transposase
MKKIDEAMTGHIRYLFEVEHLSVRQIAGETGFSRHQVERALGGKKQGPGRPAIIAPFAGLIHTWYEAHPALKAIQVLDRIRTYGFTGGYTTVKVFTKSLRAKRKSRAFHELLFLPGQEAQVDWMVVKLPFGMVYGFAFLLSWSRYLFARFYPRFSMEFFLDGHLEAFREIGGVPRQIRYDNLKSVVLKRTPQGAVYNPRFADFATHHGFSLYACTPGRANEKGRVERVIRDIGEDLVMINVFDDLKDLNEKLSRWRRERNDRIHRTTGKKPGEALKEEPLRPLPAIPCKPFVVRPAAITTTGFVTLESNRYSVPTPYAGQKATLLLYPASIEVAVKEKTIATHRRSFDRGKTFEHPGHRESLLRMTPRFKARRILELMSRMDPAVDRFLKTAGEEGEDVFTVSHGLFVLLKIVSKSTLVSAVRQALQLNTCRLSYVKSLLMPSGYQVQPVYPQNPRLLEIDYEGRDLKDYDSLG